jgi:hypothetical protein
MFKKMFIFIIGIILFIGCGDNSIKSSNEDIKLPNISSFSKKDMLFFQATGKDKNLDDISQTDDSSSSSNSDETNVDSSNSTSDDTSNAPEQNKDIISEPFKEIENIFVIQYNSFPANSTHHKTENYIEKVIIDDNRIAHILVSSIAWWLKDGDNNMSRDFQYYYISYNLNTKEKSTPKKIFENKSLNRGSLPDERVSDFTFFNGEPLLITLNSKNYSVNLYTLNKSIKIFDGGENISDLELINFNNKVYLTYRSKPDINNPSNWRFKALEVYPNIGISHNMVDKNLGIGRVNNGYIYFYREGIFYALDENMNVIDSSEKNIGEPNKYLVGNINIYDPLSKELLLKNDRVVLLNQNNSTEDIADISDSTYLKYFGRNYVLLNASVYKNKVILVYGISTNNGDKLKVIIFNRENKSINSIIVGNYIDINDYKSIAMGKNGEVVIGNIDGKYDYSAQITTAQIDINENTTSEKTIKEKILTEVNSALFGYYTDKYDQRWYISSAKAFKKVDVYSLMPIENGTAGWGVVGKNIADMDLNSGTITIGDIPNNYTNRYSVIYGKHTKVIDSNRLKSDIEMIRNSTVDIKWWFFTVDGFWFIINKYGNVYQFSYKEEVNEEGASQEVYDWKKVDLDGAMPTFFVEDGVKKFKF